MWSGKISLKSIKFSFHFSNCIQHFYSYILLKTTLKLIEWFQRYDQLKDAKNNRKQKKFSALFGCILKSIFPTSDWFCLITSHIDNACISSSTKSDKKYTSWFLLTDRISFIRSCGYCKSEYHWGYYNEGLCSYCIHLASVTVSSEFPHGTLNGTLVYISHSSTV